MRALIDTCIIIDFATARDEHLSREANYILASSYLNYYEGFISSNTVTDIYYIIHRLTHDKKTALENLSTLLDYVRIAEVTSEDCRNAALRSDKDFEDSVLMECALRYKADYIVTDNIDDYKNSPVPAICAAEFVKKLLSEK